MILKGSCVADKGQVTMNSSDATPSYTVVMYEPLIAVVMCELIVLGYSNTSVMYNQCSTKVFMEGTVNQFSILDGVQKQGVFIKMQAMFIETPTTSGESQRMGFEVNHTHKAEAN